VRPEVLNQLKNAMTSSRIEPATFRLVGARGSVVVKALCYKPEGRGFDS
jgi:hypothetical protein